MKRTGFTIIELLIVVGIIAILAGISMEAYITAQMNAKVARVKSDFRAIETAIESYHADQNSYPRMADSVGYGDPLFDFIEGIPVRGVLSKSISTPVAYLETSLQFDPFASNNEAIPLDERLYSYHVLGEYAEMEPHSAFWPSARAFYGEWRLISVGPDLEFGHGFSNSAQLPYDPTNGVYSAGNIIVGQRRSTTMPPINLLGEH